MPGKIEKRYCVEGVELLRGLTAEEMDSVERMMGVVTRKKGELLYSPADTKEVLFFLKKGAVQLYRLSPQGKKLVITTLGPNMFFGEMALVGQRMYDTFAKVVEDSILCIITREDLLRLLSEKPQIAMNLVEILGQRVLEVQSLLEDMAFKKVRTRLASLLLRIAEQRKDNQIQGVGHQDLADRLGVLRETVTETLAEFKAVGLVRLGWRKIVIANEAGLRRITDGRLLVAER